MIRLNEQEGLINIPSPGAPAKLNAEHKSFLARIVDAGPTPIAAPEAKLRSAKQRRAADPQFIRTTDLRSPAAARTIEETHCTLLGRRSARLSGSDPDSPEPSPA